MLPTMPSFEQIALNRVTFGARDLDVRDVQRTGWPAWVGDQLNPPPGDDPALAQYLKDQTLHIEYEARDYLNMVWPAVKEDRPLQYLFISGPAMWKLGNEKLFRGAFEEQQRPFEEFCSAVCIRNAHSRYQLREFMADFWLNHFHVSQLKEVQTRYALIMYDRDVIRPNVFGNFRTMLEAVATSTAMLKYLDNASSTAETPNENYARELMELHTMGRDAYLGKATGADLSARGFTDEDIIQAARALSGWTVRDYTSAENDGTFVYDPARHNAHAGRCLGVDLSPLEGIAQGRKVLDLVASHPATARYICTKICRRIFGDPVPAAVLERAVSAWRAHEAAPDQLKRVMQAILLDGPEIGCGPQQKVRRPHERMIALARLTDSLIRPHQLWSFMANAVADSPFCWATPDGRPDDNLFWLNAAINVTTWNLLSYMTTSTYAEVDYISQTPRAALASPILTVEYWVGRIIGYALSDSAMAALADNLARSAPSYPVDPKGNNVGIGYHVVSALATTPEFVYR